VVALTSQVAHAAPSSITMGTVADLALFILEDVCQAPSKSFVGIKLSG